ncbi:unnamed protein product [Rotaria magnacalcarata]|uniref:N-acetylgalactosaminide beta-1,3-galactosyltransferase n=1 Tax=Rotaria magnacalcarata TaxID=392030 RepID=A0A816QYG2_9BILA|nr:unnamed protein product [Rotaria magnacalcarata]CAF4299149.1 unnamed protein product [Rotaria magnacalcarata]
MLVNILISLHMRHGMPLIIVDRSELGDVSNMFSHSGILVFNRHQHLLSLLNPHLIVRYITQDWTTLLNIPPLIAQCPLLTTKLLLGLRFATIVSNSTSPILAPRSFFRADLLSKTVTSHVKRCHLMVVLLTSSRTVFRLDAARRTWITNLSEMTSKGITHECFSISMQCPEYFKCCFNVSDKKSAKLIIVSDVIDSRRGIITLPELSGRTNYADAQHRQLRMIKHLAEKNSHLLTNTRWIALIDDDTWLNVNQTLLLLSMLDWHKPIAVGHILTEQESDKDLLYLSGGAGIFLSMPAFSIIASKLYNSCPFCRYNDLTIGVCLAMSGIERLHVPSFLAFRPTELTREVLSNVASIHYMTPQDMENATDILRTLPSRI